MMCKCGGETRVMDSRHPKASVVKRTRVCDDCNDRFQTFESREVPSALRVNAQRGLEMRRLARQADPEKARARDKRERLRKAARKEAAATGEPVEAIYLRWGVAGPSKSKIDMRVLRQKVERGERRCDIAAFFDVSDPGLHKALRRLKEAA